ncbi:MAG TPA: polysaccharide deacetylase family protein [Sporichthya sp.]|nr:polysaccharide deacetylase family protein [Sporichthya sp.]
MDQLRPGRLIPRARGGVDFALRRSPLQPYYRRLTSRALVVLAYHGVDDPEQFTRHLSWIARSASPVSLADVIAAVHGGPALPERSVLVTFDDGARSVLESGLPLLRRRGIPAVAFVNPGVLDTDQPYWWAEAESLAQAGGQAHGRAWADPAALVRWIKTLSDSDRLAVVDELRATATTAAPRQRQLTSGELRTLESGGVAVENHTWSHPLLDRCGDEKIAEEISEGHEALRVVLGRAPRAFAYPNGNWDARAEKFLSGLGYDVAFLFDHQVAFPPFDNPLRISRVRVDSTTSMDRFAIITSGLHPAVHRRRGN